MARFALVIQAVAVAGFLCVVAPAITAGLALAGLVVVSIGRLRLLYKGVGLRAADWPIPVGLLLASSPFAAMALGNCRHLVLGVDAVCDLAANAAVCSVAVGVAAASRLIRSVARSGGFITAMKQSLGAAVLALTSASFVVLLSIVDLNFQRGLSGWQRPGRGS